MVTGRRERRMAIRLAAERAALPDPDDQEAEARIACLPGVRGSGAEPPPAEADLQVVPDATGDDDGPEEIFDDPADDDFYADAFEIIE